MPKLLLGVLLSAACLSLQVPAQAKFSLPQRTVGQKNAPITLEVFTDFECGHCREYYLHTLTRVIEEYCNKGKVYLVHHEFPLRGHVLAPIAARWAVASAAIGKSEALTEALFEKQPVWTADGNIEAVAATVYTPAEMTKLKKVMTDHAQEIDAVIQQDVFQGSQINVNQTPTSKITHKGALLTPAGNISYAIMKRFLDEELAK